MSPSAALFVPILASVLLLTSCNGPAPVTASDKKDDGARSVAVARVKRADLARSLELAAEFRPWQEIDLHAKVSGYLKNITVDVGDRVRQGQLIAELEVPEMAQELAQVRAMVKRTELEVERARGEVRRQEATYKIREVSFQRLAAVMKAKPNLVAQQEIDDYQARLHESQAQLETAKAALAVSEEQVRVATATKERLETMATYLRITAPFSGVVTKRLVDPGAMVQAGTASHTQALPVIQLSQVDHLRLILPVPESIVSKVRLGGPVEVRVDSLNRVFQGRISRFSGKLDPSTRTMETEVDIPNPQRVLMPGMYGYAGLKLDQRHDAIAAPVQAISGEGANASVFVAAGNKLEQRRVDLGIATPDFVEVLSGIKENELVVVGNRSQLRDGMLVQAKLIESANEGGSH